MLCIILHQTEKNKKEFSSLVNSSDFHMRIFFHCLLTLKTSTGTPSQKKKKAQPQCYLISERERAREQAMPALNQLNKKLVTYMGH